MMMDPKKIGWYVLGAFAVIILAGVMFYFFPFKTSSPLYNNGAGAVACTDEAKVCPDGSYVSRSGPSCDFAACPTDTTGWKTYISTKYGFTVSYPAAWTLSVSGLSNATPSLSLGNPLSGKQTYALTISIENNSSSMASDAFVRTMLQNDNAADIAAGKAGEAPSATPKYDTQKPVLVRIYQADELYNTFEYDHNAEQIFVAHGKITLKFDFPMAVANANIANAVDNNAVAHEILNTLNFTN